MEYFKNGIVFLDDITQYGFQITHDWLLHTTLETFSYDYAKVINDSGQVFGAHEPAEMEFSFVLRHPFQLSAVYNAAQNKKAMTFSVLFDAVVSDSAVKDYKDGIVADGYIVKMEQKFNTGKDDNGLDRQTILHVKLLLRSLKHITGMNGAVTTEIEFAQRINDTERRTADIKLQEGESNLKLAVIKGWSQNDAVNVTTAAGCKPWMMGIGIKNYVTTLKKLSYTKAMNRPNEVRARLMLMPPYGQEPTSKDDLVNALLNEKIILKAGEYTIFDDYYVDEVIPTYMNGIIYVDFTGYSPDNLLKKGIGCRAYVGKKLSDVAKEEVGKIKLPYAGKSELQSNSSKKKKMKEKMYLTLGDTTGRLQNLEANGQEHILPYLVQYNESTYDFLCRTANRWGEFMYYEDGELNIGSKSNLNACTFVELHRAEEEKKDWTKQCYTVSFCDPEDDQANNISVNNLSLESAQEFLGNVLHRDVYETPLNEIDSRDDAGRGYDKYVMNSISKALTAEGHLPSWASGNLVDDIVSYGLAKRYADRVREKFNDSYFEHLENGAAKEYDEQYTKENETATVYNEFSEIDYKAFEAYDTKTYPTVLAQELSRRRDTIVMGFGTHNPELKLGTLIRFGDSSSELKEENEKIEEKNYYIVTEINCQVENSKPDWKVKAIQCTKVERKDVDGKNVNHGYFYPPYLPSGHTRKTGPQKATVVDADDPQRRNRVRVRFDWQEPGSDATPWLTIAQSGTAPGALGHVRYNKGERVMVDFIAGNVERPFVTGAVQEHQPLKESWDRPVDAALRSPHGHGIVMSDGTGDGLTAFRTAMEPGLTAMQRMAPEISPMNQIDFWQDETKVQNKRFEGSVEIRDYYNIYNIKCSTNERLVSISSPWGQVDINAFTGIHFTAPNGDVNIKGQNVTIEAGNNLKLISGTSIRDTDEEDWRNQFLTNGESPSKGYWGTDWAAKAAAKVLYAYDEKGPIDFTMLRHMRDMFMKPQEGTLEVKSNRYLKLEANGRQAGYPTTSYKKLNLTENGKMTEEGWYQMGKAIARLTQKTWEQFEITWEQYVDNFDYAMTQYRDFRNAVQALKVFSEATDDVRNVDGQEICHLYAGLKDKLKDASTGSLSEDDLGFKADMVGTESSSATKQAEMRTGKTHDEIISARKTARINVVSEANGLYEAIQDIKTFKFTTDYIDTTKDYVGSDCSQHLPEDYMTALKNSLSKDNLTTLSPNLYGILSSLEDLDLEQDTYKNLADRNNEDIIEELTALKHLIWLNLLGELGFKAKKNGETVELSSLAESQDDLKGEKWNTTASYIVYKYDADDNATPLRKKMVSEQDVWSSKSGQILIATDEAAYMLGRETKPYASQSEQLKTDYLVQNLTKAVEDAIGVSAVKNIVSGDKKEVVVEKKEDVEASSMAQLSGKAYPAQENDLKKKEGKEVEKKESGQDDDNAEENAQAKEENSQAENSEEKKAENTEEKKEEKQEEKKEENQEEKKEENQKEEKISEAEQAEEDEKMETLEETSKFKYVVDPLNPDCYYHAGDIVTLEKRNYICVSNHNRNEDAIFVTLNDWYSKEKYVRQENAYYYNFNTAHPRKTFEWKEENSEDVVYGGKMASAESLALWISNILLNDYVWNNALMQLKVMTREGFDFQDDCDQVLPSNVKVRKKFVKSLFDTNNVLTSIFETVPGSDLPDQKNISNFFWDYIQKDKRSRNGSYDLQLMAPTGYLLADSMIYTRHLRGQTDHWVPYLMCVKDGEDFDTLSNFLNSTDRTQNSKTFKWKDLGTYESKSYLVDGSYHIVKLAIYWNHKYTELWGQDRSDREGKKVAMVLDFTKDRTFMPNADVMGDEDDNNEPGAATGDWTVRNITSQELKCKDTGIGYSKFEDVFIQGGV